MAVETGKGAAAMFAVKTKDSAFVRQCLEELGSPVTERRVEAHLRLAACPSRMVEKALDEVLPVTGHWHREILRICNSLTITEHLVRRLFLPGRGRRRALDLLLRLQDPRSVTGLVRFWALTGRPDPRVAEFLGRMNVPHLLDLVWEYARRNELVRLRLGELLGGLGATAGDLLSARLNDGPEEERRWALGLASLCRDPLTLGRLAEACRDAAVAAELVALLGAIPGETALLELMRLVRYAAEWDTRLQAVRIVLRRKEPQALSFLGELMNDKQWIDGLSRNIGKELSGREAGTWRSAYDTLLAACCDMG